MKYPVKRFKNLAVCLKELEPFIRNGEHLQTGKPFKLFGNLRSREVLANWLLCVAANSERESPLTFSSDPLGGDGVITDETTTWLTEHVMVPRNASGKIEELILDAIEAKRRKGDEAYASGKQLVVFSNAGDGVTWYPNRIARRLPPKLGFDGVWVMSLQSVENGEYTYAVTLLDLSEGDAPTCLVCIRADFCHWDVTRVR